MVLDFVSQHCIICTPSEIRKLTVTYKERKTMELQSRAGRRRREKYGERDDWKQEKYTQTRMG